MEAMYRVQRRSVDARQRELKVLLTLLTDDQGEPIPLDAPVPLYEPPVFRKVTDNSRQAVIVGAGPAGLFAALTLLQHGIRPIIYERGKEISERKKDIALLNRNQGLDTESNYCFGEGGAGTFSDGKLFSRSKKRGNTQRVMEWFHYFGAADNILYESHAHIGSDKLPTIIKNIRQHIIHCGGEIHFCHRVDSLSFGDIPVILAIGHSAHDTYRLLQREGVRMEAKGFAMGVRVEHPQALINRLMYKSVTQAADGGAELIKQVGNAAYSLVTQVNGRGVYSFCMCPGGCIVPAGSDSNGCVVNGMSASRRNSPYANSGIVVEIHPEDLLPYSQQSGIPIDDPLIGLSFQEQLERLAQTHGQAPNQAPAQRLRDFVEGHPSKDLPVCSYLPGIVPSRLDQWLPKEIGPYLQQGFRDFDHKYPGFLTNDAVVVGVESRSSSPVRIVRDPQTMQSVSHPTLYPCGEGAGYAGGITSSALDGIRAAEALCARLEKIL